MSDGIRSGDSRQAYQVEACKRAARGLLQASPGRKITEIDREEPGRRTRRPPIARRYGSG